MMNEFEQQQYNVFLKNAYKWKIGYALGIKIIEDDSLTNYTTYEQLQRTEWSKDFENLVGSLIYNNYNEYFKTMDCSWYDRFLEFCDCMKRRLIFGSLRYGVLGAEGKSIWDKTSGMTRYFIEYMNSGNLEFLVDVGNYCLLEFVEGCGNNNNYGCNFVFDNVNNYNEDVVCMIEEYKKTKEKSVLIIITMLLFFGYFTKIHPKAHFDARDEKGFHVDSKI